MKRLTVSYNGQVLFDDEVSYFHWDDDDGSVVVRGSNKPPPAKPGLPQLLSRAAGELGRNGKP